MSGEGVVPAVPSATLVLIRENDGGMELFMVKRHAKIDFAPGALVFPGGALEENDYLPQWRDYLDDTSIPDEEIPWRIAAIRETYEESGILLARNADGTTLEEDYLFEKRQELEEHRLTFLELVQNEDLRLCVGQMECFANWITPIQSPKRFDTLFYLAPAPQGQDGEMDGYEVVETLWDSGENILQLAEDGAFTVVFATEMNVSWVTRHSGVDAAMKAAAEKQVNPVLATVHIEGEKVWLRIPEEAGYGVTEREWKL
jgi:8-oxo-dGTP pyrophosphatase MutT (NUDIX family)